MRGLKCSAVSGWVDEDNNVCAYHLEKRNKGSFTDSADQIRFGSFSAKPQTGAHWIVTMTKIPVNMLKSFKQHNRHFDFKI